MKKIIILIPVFNDWESLIKLLKEIDENIKDIKNISFKCLVVNDASTIKQPDLQKPKNISSLKILNMKTNKGHARCNAFGIRYVIQNEKFDYLILMDGDGEDRPDELESLINEVLKNPTNSVVAKRVKRSEGAIFQFLYFMHKIITHFFTGKIINFGNERSFQNMIRTIIYQNGCIRDYLNYFIMTCTCNNNYVWCEKTVSKMHKFPSTKYSTWYHYLPFDFYGN